MTGRAGRVAIAAALLAGLARPGLADPDPLDDHQLDLPAAVDLAVGQRQAVSLTLAARPGFRISDQGPVRIELAVTPTPGLGLARARLARSDAADPRAAAPRFDLGLRAEAAGDYRLAVSAAFWVCGRHTCRPVHERREVAVRVAPAAGPPGG